MPDTPTRRLDDVPNDPSSSFCVKCGGPMIWAWTAIYPFRQLDEPRLYVQQRKKAYRPKRSLCNALVCVECGYTEFYTRTPKRLLE